MSNDKVHLVMLNHRCRESGEVYNAFDALWIATLEDGHCSSSDTYGTQTTVVGECGTGRGEARAGAGSGSLQ